MRRADLEVAQTALQDIMQMDGGSPSIPKGLGSDIESDLGG
jgi:hypothetical protein